MSWAFRALRGGVTYEVPSYITAEFGYTMSDVSGLKMVYSKDGVNAAQLVDDTVIVALWKGVEPFNSRWIVRGGEDPDQIEGHDFSVVGKSILDAFRKVVVHAVVAGQNVVFNTATPGFILKTLIDAAQARGALTNITYNFTNTTDSNGVAWPDSLSIEYNLGLDYLKILQNLFDKGLIEFRMNGYQLQVFVGGTMGTDRTSGAGMVELRAGRDLTEVPMRWSSDEKVKRVLVVGDDKIVVERTSAAWVAGPFGDEEASLSQGGTKDNGTLTFIGDHFLSETELRKTEYTRKLKLTSTSKIPAADFQVGDWVRERVGDNSLPYRVRAIVINTDGATSNMDASLVLNDQLLESAVKNARRVEGIIGGAGAANSIPGEAPPDPPADTTTPSAPTGLTVNATQSYYDNSGHLLVVVVADWNAPLTNTDASLLDDLQDYEVQWKYTSEGAGYWRGTVVTDSIYTNGGYLPNRGVDFRVKARDTHGHSSAWTTVVSATTAADSTAPSVPSTPTAAAVLGVVRVAWDGLASGGGAMPIDFDHVDVHRSTTSGFTPSASTVFARMEQAGTVPSLGQAYGVPWYYKLVAVDTSGNSSAGSAQATATTSQLVSGDLADLSVIAGKVAANSITTLELAAGSVYAENIAALQIDATKLTATAIDGKMITGATFRTSASGERIVIDGGGEGDSNQISFWSDAAKLSRIRSNNPGNSFFKGLLIQGAQNPSGIMYNGGLDEYLVAPMINFIESGKALRMGVMYGDAAQMDGGAWQNEGASLMFEQSGVDPNHFYVAGEADSWSFQFDGPAPAVEFLDLKEGGVQCDGMAIQEFVYSNANAVNVTATGGGASIGTAGGEGVFVAPPSGIVYIHFTAVTKAPAAGSYISTGVQVRNGATIGSGVIVSPTFAYSQGAENYNAQYQTVTKWRKLTGLTPMASYNVQQYATVQSGTGSIARGMLRVEKSM